MLSEDLLRRMWPRCAPTSIAGIVASAPAVLDRYGITTPLLLAHAMAQFSQEWGAGTEPVENLSYTSPARIAAVWPSRFSTASAVGYVRNPKALADKVYNGRMGNQPGSDDGFNFRGRGLSQVTGREGYEKLGAKTGLDLVGDPDLVNSPENLLECGVADFILCGCLPFAARDDVLGVTHHLNGGTIGLAERKTWLARWKAALAAEHPEVVAAPEALLAPAGAGTLRYGDKGWEVKAVQQRLSDLGYPIGDPDQDFSTTTRAQVLAFQANEGLETTGIVDQGTRDSLAAAQPMPVAEVRTGATEQDLRAKGSETVAAGDQLGNIGKVGGVGSLLVGAQQAGVIDKVRDATDKVGAVHSFVDALSDALQWASSHWWIAGLLGAGAAWYFGRKVIARRVADHRSGANMGR